MYIIPAEGVRVLPPEQLVQSFACVRQFFVVRNVKREVRQVEDSLQTRHLLLVYHVYHVVTHKQQSAFRMIHDIVNLFAVEFMQDGYYHRSISQRGQKRHCPMGRVTATYGYAVSFFYSGSMHHNVQLLYLSGYVVILQRSTFIVCQSV